MPRFLPPVVFDSDRIEKTTRGLPKALFRHFPGPGTAWKVIKRTDGHYTTGGIDSAETTVLIYYGGNVYVIDIDEAARLIAAGYGAYVFFDDVPTDLHGYAGGYEGGY